jgi:hypothetical protein
MPARPPPTCTRAARGPMLVRTPRLEARTRTPGASLIEKPTTQSYWQACRPVRRLPEYRGTSASRVSRSRHFRHSRISNTASAWLTDGKRTPEGCPTLLLRDMRRTTSSMLTRTARHRASDHRHRSPQATDSATSQNQTLQAPCRGLTRREPGSQSSASQRIRRRLGGPYARPLSLRLLTHIEPICASERVVIERICEHRSTAMRAVDVERVRLAIADCADLRLCRSCRVIRGAAGGFVPATSAHSQSCG